MLNKHPNIPLIKSLILLQLGNSGPQKLDGNIWPALQEYQKDYPNDFGAFRDRALSELAAEGFMICSSGKVFLGKPLASTMLNVTIDLHTALRLAALVNSCHEDAPVDGLHLTAENLSEVADTAWQLVEHGKELQRQVSEYESKRPLPLP